jgi:hypothetical protein
MHYELPFYKEHIKATNIVVGDWTRPLTITAVYKPPRHNASTEMFKNFFQALRHRFMAGADYNAKNAYWRARITHLQVIQLMAAVNELHLDRHTTGEPK